MKKIFLAIAIITTLSASAQVTNVSLQAAGLTCSMCSNSISKALKTLAFAAAVTPDIKNSSFEITIRPGSKMSFDEIRKKVEGAGFSVASMKATIRFKDQQVINDGHINAGGLTLHFINVKDQVLNGDRTVQVLDKGFVPAKTFAKNAVYTKMDCYKTGFLAGTRVYQVTM